MLWILSESQCLQVSQLLFCGGSTVHMEPNSDPQKSAGIPYNYFRALYIRLVIISTYELISSPVHIKCITMRLECLQNKFLQHRVCFTAQWHVLSSCCTQHAWASLQRPHHSQSIPQGLNTTASHYAPI